MTFAGLLVWQGALLLVLGKTGTVNLNDSGITDLANTFYSDVVGWIFAAVVIVAFAAVLALGHRRRAAAGRTTEPRRCWLIRIAVVAAVTIAAIAILNSDRGLPLALMILLAFVVGFQLRRHANDLRPPRLRGRRQRRGGAPRRHPRQPDPRSPSSLCRAMAAVGGIMAASRLLAVNQSSGGRTCCCWRSPDRWSPGRASSAAAARSGRRCSAHLVIGSISNGMDLLALAVLGEVHGHRRRPAARRDRRRDRPPAARRPGRV